MKSTLRMRRPGTFVENDAFFRMVGRLVAAGSRRVATSDAEDLAALIKLQAQVEAAMLDAIRGLRSSGVTWEEIGQAFGTTRQAALMRWGPRLEENTPGLTRRGQ
jgi:hypothetical protein